MHPDAADADGITPLMMAAGRGKLQELNALLEVGGFRCNCKTG